MDIDTTLNVIFAIIALAVLIASLVFITMATSTITKAENYSTDARLKDAHSYLLWTTIIVWIVTALLIVGIILGLIFARDYIADDAEYITGIVGDILIILCLAVGVLSSIAAFKIFLSPNGRNGKGKDALWDCVIAMILTFGLAAVLILKLMVFSLF